MKKGFIGFLLVAMFISVCVGCGAENTTTESSETVETAEATQERTTEQTEEATETTSESTEQTFETTEEPGEEVVNEIETAEATPETTTETETTEATPEPMETVAPESMEEPTPEAEPQATYTYTDMSAIMYAQQTVNVRDLPGTDGNKLGALSTNDEITITGQCNETGWYRFAYNGSTAYVSNKYIGANKVEVQQQATAEAGVQQDATQEASKSGYFYQNAYGQTLTMTYDEVRAVASQKYPLYQLIDNGTNEIVIYYICNHFRDNPTTPPNVSFGGSAELVALCDEAARRLFQRGYTSCGGTGDRYEYYDGHNYSIETAVYIGQQ